jgi:hypothetical protein
MKLSKTIKLVTSLTALLITSTSFAEYIYSGKQTLPAFVIVSGGERVDIPDYNIRDRRVYEALMARGYREGWTTTGSAAAYAQQRTEQKHSAEDWRRNGGLKDSGRPGMKYGFGKYAIAPIAVVAGAVGAVASGNVEAAEVRPTVESGLATDGTQKTADNLSARPIIQGSQGAERFGASVKQQDQRR